MYPFASLPENLAAFCDVLRRQFGFRIGSGELQDAARALDVIDLADPRAVRDALRPVLAGTRDDSAVFDAAFARFFFPGPSSAPQDQMPSTRREPGTEADGRDADAPRPRHAPRSDAGADEASHAERRSDDRVRVVRRRGGRGRAHGDVELQPACRRRVRRP